MGLWGSLVPPRCSQFLDWSPRPESLASEAVCGPQLIFCCSLGTCPDGLRVWAQPLPACDSLPPRPLLLVPHLLGALMGPPAMPHFLRPSTGHPRS